MKCISCGARTDISTTSNVTELNKCLLIIRNTPCHKCMECNEIMYTGDVIKVIDEIIKKVEQSINEITIIDFNTLVA